MKRIIQAIPLALIVTLGAGCATTGDLEKTDMIANQAKTTADEALHTAQIARQMAQEALAAAKEAKASSQKANTKIDRAFQQAMEK